MHNFKDIPLVVTISPTFSLSLSACEFVFEFAALSKTGAMRHYRGLHLRHWTLKLQKIRHSRVALCRGGPSGRTRAITNTNNQIQTHTHTRYQQHVRLSIRVHWNGNSALQRRKGRKYMLDWLSDGGRILGSVSLYRATDGLFLAVPTNCIKWHSPRTAFAASSDLSFLWQ